MMDRSFPMLTRLGAVLAVAVVAPLVVACGDELDAAVDTLPPMRTTTSTTTTTTTPDDRRKFYEVKPGDNVNDIARRTQVPAQEIIDLNGLPENGYLQVGQIIELPVDVVLVTELPELPDETTIP